MSVRTIFVTRQCGFTVHYKSLRTVESRPAQDYFGNLDPISNVLVEDEHVLLDMSRQLQGGASQRARELHILAGGHSMPMITTPQRLAKMAPSWGVRKDLTEGLDQLDNPWWVINALAANFRPRQPYRDIEELMESRLSNARMSATMGDSTDRELFFTVRNLKALDHARPLLMRKGFLQAESQPATFKVSDRSIAFNPQASGSVHIVVFNKEDYPTAGKPKLTETGLFVIKKRTSKGPVRTTVRASAISVEEHAPFIEPRTSAKSTRQHQAPARKLPLDVAAAAR